MKKRLILKGIKPYIILILLSLSLVLGVVLYRAVSYEPNYVYIKVRIGQGFWWASTAKPQHWYANSIRKGDVKYNLFGHPEAEIVSVRKYPFWGTDQVDVYAVLRLDANYNSQTKAYSYNRTHLAVGSPLEIALSSTFLSGTIVDISQDQIKDEYVEKTVTFVLRGGYSKDSPYLFESLSEGDTYFDGEDTVFEVLDVSLRPNIWVVQNNLNAQVFEREINTTQDILLVAKMRLLNKDGSHFFAEGYQLKVNSKVPISTEHATLFDFVIEKIE